MKSFLFYCLAFFLTGYGAEIKVVPFKANKLPGSPVRISKHETLKFSKKDRLVLKGSGGEILLLQLLKSEKGDTENDSVEICSVIWTLISEDGASSGSSLGRIQYEKKELKPNQYFLKPVEGSNRIQISNFKIRWSYADPDGIHLYPEPGYDYALTTIRGER